MLGLIDRYFIKQPRLRLFVSRAIEGDRDIRVQVLGTDLHLNTIKEHGYLRASRLVRNSALLREEIPVLLNLASLFSDGDTFIDVGANVGIFSLTFGRFLRTHRKSRVYAFEANPDTYSRLVAEAAALGVITENVAISDQEGILEFVPGAVSHVFTTVDNANDYSLHVAPVNVACRRLDQCTILGDSLILKIDVEGQELRVLTGARSFFDTGRVKAVYLDGYKDRAVEQFLRDYGFGLYEGKTLMATEGDVFSLLALRPSVVAPCAEPDLMPV